MPLVLSLTAVVKEMGTSSTGLLDAHVQERQAATAGFRALRNGVAVILSNSTENNDELDRLLRSTLFLDFSSDHLPPNSAIERAVGLRPSWFQTGFSNKLSILTRATIAPRWFPSGQ